jgi:hypothetical protein
MDDSSHPTCQREAFASQHRWEDVVGRVLHQTAPGLL